MSEEKGPQPKTPRSSALSVTSNHPEKVLSSTKLTRKSGIFGQAKNVRSASSISQPVQQNNIIRPKTASTISDRKLSSRQNSVHRLVKNSLSKCSSIVSLSSTIGTPRSAIHKPGTIPSYLKGDSKSTVESEFSAKYRKFKIEKKKLVDIQVQIKKEFDELKRLKQKLLGMGGKDLKLDEITLVEFDEDGIGDKSKLPLKCEGTAIEIAKKQIDSSLMNDIEGQIRQIQEGDLELRNSFMKACAEISSNLHRIQDVDVRGSCVQSLNMFKGYNEHFASKETTNNQLLSQNLLKLRKEFVDVASELVSESSLTKSLTDQRSKILEFQIENTQLRKTVDELGKKLKLSEHQLKAQEMMKRDYETTIENLQKKIEENLGDIDKLKGKSKNSKIAEEKYKKDAEALRSDITSNESDTTKLKAELNSMRNQIKLFDQQSSDLKNKLRLSENKCADFKNQLEVATSETVTQNERLGKQIEELQCNLDKREVKVTNLQQLFRAQDTDNTAKEFNNAMEGIRRLRNSSSDYSRLDDLKKQLNHNGVEIADRNDTFSAIQKLLVIRDSLSASVRQDLGSY